MYGPLAPQNILCCTRRRQTGCVCACLVWLMPYRNGTLAVAVAVAVPARVRASPGVPLHTDSQGISRTPPPPPSNRDQRRLHPRAFAWAWLSFGSLMRRRCAGACSYLLGSDDGGPSCRLSARGLTWSSANPCLVLPGLACSWLVAGR